MLNKPNIEEYCEGEFKDYLLELIKRDLKSIPESTHCRRRDIASAILAVNKEVGERERTKQELCKLIPKITFNNLQEGKLSKLGFKVIKGKGHYKVAWHDSPYRVTFSATPSDFRFPDKLKIDLTRIFF